MNRYVAGLLGTLLVLLVMHSCVYEEPTDTAEGSIIHPGDTLPVFTIEMSDGSIVTTSDLAGRQAAILFFTVSCQDCRGFLPKMQRYYEEHPEVRVICIGREEPADTVAAYWRAQHLTLPYSPQPDRTIYSLFARSGVPRLYLTDSSLTVTAVYSPDSLVGF